MDRLDKKFFPSQLTQGMGEHEAQDHEQCNIPETPTPGATGVGCQLKPQQIGVTCPTHLQEPLYKHQELFSRDIEARTYLTDYFSFTVNASTHGDANMAVIVRLI